MAAATTVLTSGISQLGKMLRTHPHDAVPSTLIFCQVDDAKIQREMRLEERGAERGAEGFPSETATTLDEVENEIIARLESEKHRCTDEFNQQLALYDQRLVGLGIQDYASHVHLESRKAVSNFRAETQDRLNALTVSRDEVVRSRSYLQEFRDIHGLRRPAQYPISHVQHASIIAAIFMAEAILNGTFFAKGSDYGFLGGSVQALIIALLNVGLALAAGRAIVPLINHKSNFKKLIGVNALAIYIPIVCFYNLGVAHFRDAIGMTADVTGAGDVSQTVPAQMALNTLLSRPLGIADLESWILFGVGVLFAAVAVFKGYRWDDPYPGYGRQHRHSVQLHDEYVQECREAIDALQEISENSSRALNNISEELRRRLREQEAILVNRDRLIRQFCSHLDYLERVANKLLSTYRGANRKARGAIPVPAHYAHDWTMARPFDHIREAPKLSQTSFDERLSTEIRESIDTIHNEFVSSVEKIKKIEDLAVEPDGVVARQN